MELNRKSWKRSKENSETPDSADKTMLTETRQKSQEKCRIKRKIPLSLMKSARTWSGYLLLIIVPVACFYFVESFTHNPWEMALPIQMINAVFYLLLLLLLLGLTGRIGIAAALTTVVALLVGFANYVVLAFRGTPILPWDLLSLNTALTVQDNYKLPIVNRLFIIPLIAAVIIAFGFFARLRLRPLLVRLALITCSLILLGSYVTALHSTRFTNYFGFDSTLFTPGYLYKQNGFATSFLINLKYLNVDEPQGYSLSQVEELASDIEEKTADDTAIPAEVKAEEMPNILVVMDESFSDLSVLTDFETNEDYMPFFRSLTENTVRGNLYVSIVGGNTATTEFEFLTGDSMAFLPAGSVAYQQYIKTKLPSLPSALEDLGYQTVAMHPYYAGGWDRDEVYEYFGFDDILFKDDFDYRQLLRNYISDHAVVSQIIQAYETKQEGQPLFSFAVTMQNHGGYGTKFSNFSPDIEVLESEGNFTAVETYLSLIKKTDTAFQELIEYFKTVDEKTIILMFGDHQPNDSVVSSLLALDSAAGKEAQQAQNRYVVPYAIWANYDIQERSGVDISANFLSSLLLDTAGIPQTEYGYFLSELQAEIPVMTANFYLDAAGNSHDYNEAVSSQEELFNDYAILQYNHLFDHQNCLTAFFEQIEFRRDSSLFAGIDFAFTR